MTASTTSRDTSLTIASQKKEQTSFLSLPHELRQKILFNYFEHTIVIVRQQHKGKYLLPEQVRSYTAHGNLSTPVWPKTRGHARVAAQLLRGVDARIAEDVDDVVNVLRGEIAMWLAEKGSGWREDLGLGGPWGGGLDSELEKELDVAVSMRRLDGRDGGVWKKMVRRCLGILRY